MGIRVTFVPMELTGSTTKHFEEADRYCILEDNTIELRQTTNPGRYRVIGAINANQWQSVEVVDEIAEAES